MGRTHCSQKKWICFYAGLNFPLLGTGLERGSWGLRAKVGLCVLPTGLVPQAGPSQQPFVGHSGCFAEVQEGGL